ncbi:hypothetical protein Fot_02498 [Forsythia ovata]|uniref:Uncharacterized protein n=1 Tax=Forsythia ovata TaxID=205694 RepID=A0ABD1X708_9LAMI
MAELKFSTKLVYKSIQSLMHYGCTRLRNWTATQQSTRQEIFEFLNQNQVAVWTTLEPKIESIVDHTIRQSHRLMTIFMPALTELQVPLPCYKTLYCGNVQ